MVSNWVGSKDNSLVGKKDLNSVVWKEHCLDESYAHWLEWKWGYHSVETMVAPLELNSVGTMVARMVEMTAMWKVPLMGI
jgi:hypothetical protein